MSAMKPCISGSGAASVSTTRWPSPQMFSGADLLPRRQCNTGPLGLPDRNPSDAGPSVRCRCVLARVYKVNYDLYCSLHSHFILAITFQSKNSEWRKSLLYPPLGVSGEHSQESGVLGCAD